MGDIQGTGLSGLQAFQRALETTGHNIANANTDGYVRQTVEFSARPAQAYGSGYIGNGVDVQSIKRNYDQFLVDQSRGAASSVARLDTLATQAARVSSLFGDTTTGVSATLQQFQNALQGVATQPTSIPARQVLLGQAATLADRLTSYDAQLRSYETQSATQIQSDTATVNTLAQGVANLNKSISDGFLATGQPPNDLMDARDRLIDQLAQHVNVSTVAGANGTTNVFIGNGQALVLNTTASTLTTAPDPFDATLPRVVVTGAQGPTDITTSLSGGSLGGLLDFRSQVLDPARNALGRIALGVTDAVNQQHKAGLDLNGAFGADFFSIGAPTVLPSGRNTGAASVAASVSSVPGLTDAEYQIQYTGGAWALKRLDTGASVTMTGAGTVASPYQADGISLVVSGAPAAGDKFVIRPTREAISGLGVLITDPARVAASSPVLPAVNAANTGSAAIASTTITNPANPALRSTATVQFLTPTTYSINGAGSFAYTAGQPIAANGWSVQLSGAPAAGDSFTVADNGTGTGDNRNALAIAAALNASTLSNGTTSVSAAASRLSSSVGLTTQQAQINRDAQQVMLDDANIQRTNSAGVNLDEEAANLIRFQQAYQAAAQVIKTASSMFETLLAAVQR
jgi:flagellar hook-associated protein 1 FlgK